MSDAHRTNETKSPTITDLWNDRLVLSAQIEELLKPFLQKYSIRAEDVEIGVHYSGVSIKVKL